MLDANYAVSGSQIAQQGAFCRKHTAYFRHKVHRQDKHEEQALRPTHDSERNIIDTTDKTARILTVSKCRIRNNPPQPLHTRSAKRLGSFFPPHQGLPIRQGGSRLRSLVPLPLFPLPSFPASSFPVSSFPVSFYRFSRSIGSVKSVTRMCLASVGCWRCIARNISQATRR